MNFLKKRLAKFDRTYWKYQPHFQTIYVSVKAGTHALIVSQFIVHTNGQLEYKLEHKGHEELDSYLRSLSNHEYSETFDKDDKPKYIFSPMNETNFISAVEKDFLSKLDVAERFSLKLVQNTEEAK